MKFLRLVVLVFLAMFTIDTVAGSKRLVVAFLDFSSDGVGKASFKVIRASRYEHACWQRFVEIEGIETAYIEHVPKALDRAIVLAAVQGSAPAAAQLSKTLRAEGLSGALVYLPDAVGSANIYGINYADGAVSSSSPIRKPEHGLIARDVFSKALCEASKSMD